MKYIDAGKLRAEIKRLEGVDYPCDTSEQATGFYDALDRISRFLDTQQEPEISNELLEYEPTRAVRLPDGRWVTEELAYQIEINFMAEVKQYYSDNFEYLSSDQPTLSILTNIARHFAEWGARHSINWGDIQLLDTFILELSREEKDGADWGDSEKYYTEVLRRFHEFNDKKIPEIVAEWEAEHLKK